MRRLIHRLGIWAFHALFARPVLWFFAGLRFRRRGLVPEGPCMVVSNHNSHLDAAILMTLFPLRRLPRVHPVAAADYFGNTLLKRALALWLMNGIPIERSPGRGMDPLAGLQRALAAGDSLIFFPEGSRGEAGVVAPFRAGIGRIVRQLPGLLIVPVYLSGPERIWARGQVVPVPQNIDAIVGRPRTYSPDLEPRQIAEQVRRDVLALAPPPPPEPSPRPASPLRIAVCGIDPVDRDRLFRALVERLGRVETTIGLGDAVLESDETGVREVTGPIPMAPGRIWLGLLARLFRTGGLFKGERFVAMVDRAQVDEALGHDVTRRFVVTQGSPLVDLLAWAEADFYHGVFDASGMNRVLHYLTGQRRIPLSRWWRFVWKAPEVWLVNTFSLARPPAPNLLVAIRSPVPRRMKRIRSEGRRLQRFENEAFLERLQRAYGLVGELLSKRHKATVLEVDGAEWDEAAVLDRIEETCRRLVEQRQGVPAGS